ncbi:MAG: response regulator receiver [Ignavibacteria bacterium]|nr:MAG: response regulator receiver [Ignavibacteria bacterium]KAF0157185.1 MAG: response regulator receiver [Ignavibacteria bacterium]
MAKKQTTSITNAAAQKKETAKAPKAAKLFDEESMYFKAIYENVGFGIVLFTPERKIIKINNALCQMLGYTEQEIKQLTIIGISHPQDFEKDKKLFKELCEGKRTQYQLDKRYLKKDGGILYGKLSVSVVKKSAAKAKVLIAFVEDITEQKEIASKFEAEQNLLQALLNSTPDSIYFKDLKSKIIKVNPAMALKHNVKNPNDLIGKTDFDMFGDEHAISAFNDEQEIIATGKAIICKEEKEDWQDGKTTWVSSSKMPLYDQDGMVIGTFGISRDMTEEIVSKQRIKESEFLYRSLFENSIDGMFLMRDVVIDCNQAVCDILKYNRFELIGLSPAQFSPKYQPDGLTSEISATRKINDAMNGIPQRFDWVHITKNGEQIDTEVTLKAVSMEGKNLIQAILRDVTERNRKEKIQQALFDISEYAYTASDMYSLFHKIHEVVGGLMSAKNFYIALYDEKSDTISFPYFVDEFDPPQPPKKVGKGLTEYVLRTGKATLIDAHGDLELRRSGDVELIGAPQAIWLGVPLKISDKTIGVIVVQDYEKETAFGQEELSILIFVAEQVAQVIARKQSSDELKKVADELKILNTTKDKFFSIIAHDLKNPFITILGFSDLLLTDYSELSDDERKFYLEEMKKSAEVSHNLLQNLLQWSRSQTGRIEFHPAAIALANLVKVNMELLETTASRKNISIVYEIQNNINVFADEDMLNTVIRNLITNAIKFTGVNGIITIRAEEQGKYAEISVTDTGVGMDDKVLSNLFRLDISHTSFGTNKEAGTGLGLILCKEFIEKQGGKIWVESEIGKGSKFIFYLPLVSND